MAIDLKASLLEYANGIEDRSGTSRLDIDLATLLRDGLVSEDVVASSIRDACAEESGDASRLWEGAAFLLRKLGMKSSLVGRVIEDVLDAGHLDAETRYYALDALSVVAGGLTPRQVNDETTIKTEKPGLWLDLALDAYRGDAIGAKSAVSSLLTAHPPADWKILRQRLPKLRDAFGGNLYGVARDLAGLMPNIETKRAWLGAVDKRYGTNLSDLETGSVYEPLASVRPDMRADIRRWAEPRVAAAVAPLRRFRTLEATHG